MRSLLLTVVLAIWSCSADQSVSAQAREVVVPDHSLDAFGGRLLGVDRGEWGGKLLFQDADGNLYTVLTENILGIVKNSDGIFAFTGLAHRSVNDGYIYVITRDADGSIKTFRLGRLPGAPSRVTQLQPDGVTSFLVYSGISNGRSLFECYQLSGKIISRGHDCLPPE